ncbi:Coilin [Hirschfeldia incana]|nr:Coilin [Hirschfeldia incana]
MEPEKVRIRLVFEDQRVLSKTQKKQGLKRSWVVLDPKCHRTVSEFSNHLLHTFCLFEACPHGLSLSMDGFVLPPFESSCVLKDKDIVCVKRKKEPLLENVEEDSEENVCAAIEDEERAAPGAMLLANEEFQKETGGYKSESEEDELEEVVPEKKTSKKRKASSKSISSKRKKCKLATTEESPLEKENEAVVSNAVKKRKTSDAKRTENDEQDEIKAKSKTKSKKSSKQAESKEPNEQCNVSGETKKTPSRSARRKKAKRQWLREKTKLEKEEYIQLQQKQMVVAPSQKTAFTTNHQATKGNLSEALGTQQPDEHGNGVGDEVVPVEVRPGHIRFEPLDETDQDSAEVAPPAENFVWNGNMTKKKGQKWGTEKAGFSKRYAQDMDKDTYQTHPAETETLAKGQIDFEQLAAYSGSVKKGDVIAYRLIELTSSWTPEVSSFRVGKISYYDPESKKVTLMPVQEYPIEEKKTAEDDEDSSMQPDASLYKEDGSLEIEYSSLLDVRCIETSSSNSAEAAKSAPSKPDQTATNLKPSTDNGLQTFVKENGKRVDPWEELSDALSAKKAQLSQANNGWNKKGSSSGGVSTWSYKALRGSGMGPVMKYLRSQKEI